jgi:hypothetical protein
MSMDRRIGSLEDHNLGPREAVILWMGEAHRFDSFLDYATGSWSNPRMPIPSFACLARWWQP